MESSAQDAESASGCQENKAEEDMISVKYESSASEKELGKQLSIIRKSFSSPSKVVLVAGVCLATCAGMVNAVAVLQLGVFVSHVTGAVARIGVRAEGLHIGRNTPDELRVTSLLVLSFIFGALLCGLLIAKNDVHFGKSLYGVALLGNAALLTSAAFLDHNEAAIYFAAAACGLQNGMCTMHFGAVVRTTHVTGLATDLGTAAGRLLAVFLRRGCRRSRFNAFDIAEVEVDVRRMRVFCLLGLAFSIGVFGGAFLQRWWGVHALLLPAAITGSSGLMYTILGNRLQKRMKALEVNRLEADVEEVHSVLERTRSYLKELRKKLQCSRSELSTVRTSGDLNDTIELDDRMGHMLEVMHDVEESMQQIYGSLSDHPKPGRAVSPTRRTSKDAAASQ